MYAKKIKYTDYDGVEREETFWFNLNKVEQTELQVSEIGGLQKVLEQIIKTEDYSKLVTLFQTIILKSYGEKSLDGKRFIKSKEKTEEFAQTEAYVELFTELATDDKAAADFVNGIIQHVETKTVAPTIPFPVNQN